MSEHPPVSQDDLKKLLSIRGVRLRLLKIAYNRAGKVADAEDLVQQTSELLLQGLSPWTPDPDRPAVQQVEAFLLHAALIIRRLHLNRVKSLEARRTKEIPKDLADTVGDGSMNVEETAIELAWEQEYERRAAVWTEALCERMAGDRDALAVIGQHKRNVHEAQAQAEALGWKLSRVVLAKRRIAYHAPIVRREQLEAERRAEEERIAAARAAAKAEKAVKKEVQP
jgi:DNA-directed RNA polymerase specialized sigma24 family protein